MSIDTVSANAYHLVDEGNIAAELGGDVDAQLAALLLTSAHDSREAARVERDQEEAQLGEAEQHQVELMLKQADSIRAAGRARGYGMIASGALTVEGGLTALAVDLHQPGTKVGAEFESSLAGGGKLVEGVFDLGATGFEAAEATQRAQATAMGNQAEESTRRLDELSAQIADARDLARTALEFLRNVKQAETQSDQASLYLRA